MVKQIVIVGVGGFGRETAFLIEEINRHESQWELLGFVDEDESQHGKLISGYPVLGGLKKCFDIKKLAITCSIGNTKDRKRIVEILKGEGLKFPNLIHPGVISYPGNSIGIGNIINPGNIINLDVTIGNHVCFEMASTIGHDVVIEDFVSIMPGVNVSGNVILEEGCYLGTGCTIIQGKRIGKWATVGAGALVIENVLSYTTVVGVPAKVIKTHQQNG